MNPSRRQLARLSIADMAVDDRIYVVRCNLCRKTDYYLATDLEALYGGEAPAFCLFVRCRRCRKAEWLHVTTVLPLVLDTSKLTVRRPAGHRRWQDAPHPDATRT